MDVQFDQSVEALKQALMAISILKLDLCVCFTYQLVMQWIVTSLNPYGYVI